MRGDGSFARKRSADTAERARPVTAAVYDLRARTLAEQALGAIHDYAQNVVEPTEEQLALIGSSNAPTSSSSPLMYLKGLRAAGRLRFCRREDKLGKTRPLMFVETELTPGSTKGIWCAPAVRSAPGVLRRVLQNPVALGRERDCSLLPRQECENAGRGRCVFTRTCSRTIRIFPCS
jgi:hypothetical protein